MPIRVRAFISFSVWAVFAFALTGCTGLPFSGKLNCQSLQVRSISQPGKKFDLVNFSVRLPQDSEKWCIGSSNIGSLALFTHPLMGKSIDRPTPDIALNTIAMAAMELKHDQDRFTDEAKLKAFVENWINLGFGAEGEPPELKVMNERVERFILLHSKLDALDDPLKVCVRYEYLMEEKDNPRAPGQVLFLEDIGLVCQHQHHSSHLVVLSLSERYSEGGRLDPSLFSHLKENVAPAFFNSLEF